MSLFTRKAQLTRFAVFHIESAGVHASLVELSTETSVPRILTTVQVNAAIASELTSTSLTQSILKALKEAASLISTTSFGGPQEIICFLGAPWYATEVRKIRMAKNTVFPVTEKLLRDLVKKEIDLFERELAGEVSVIEREVNGLLVNGYPVVSLVEAKAKEVEISLILSVSPKEVLKEFTGIFSQAFNRTTVIYHSFAYAGTHIMNDLFVSHNDFIVLDIGGEMTDLFIVNSGTLRVAGSFPFGTNTLTRNMAAVLNTSVEEASTLISLHAGGKLSPQLEPRVKNALEKTLRGWTGYFEKALAASVDQVAIPSSVMMFTPNNLHSIFKEAVTNESFIQFRNPDRPFVPISLTHDSFKSYASWEFHPPHPQAVIESLLVAKKYGSI